MRLLFWVDFFRVGFPPVIFAATACGGANLGLCNAVISEEGKDQQESADIC